MNLRTRRSLLTAGLAWPAYAAPPRRVVLISLDGLRPDLYLNPVKHGLKLPNLARLMASGSFATGVEGVYPSVTYPSHTTLITGTVPARHGIFGNEQFRPEDPRPPWYFEHRQIKATTLWQAARAAGLTTAGVAWPVSVGAPVDWLIPEYFDTKRQQKNVFRAVSTPGLYETIERKFGAGGLDDFEDWADKDVRITDCAVHIIREHKPHFTAIHLINGDHQQHETGLETAEVRAAFNALDQHVGRIVTALDGAGIRKETAVVVTGDHGFLPVTKTVNPNVPLHNAGLQELEGDKVTSWQAYAWAQGGCAAVHLKDPAHLAKAKRALEVAIANEPTPPLKLISRQQLDQLGAFPGAAFGVEALNGARVGKASSGDFVGPSRTKGMHGYLPTNPAMRTGLIVSGLGIRRGVVLGLMPMVDIAPTIGKLLGVRLPMATGKPIVRMLS